MELIFYTTDGCHLCEQAEQVLMTTPLADPVPVSVVDISESEALVGRYGTRIPVLQRDDTGAELNWPFDGTDVQQFVARPVSCAHFQPPFSDPRE